jgi:hypothetical protein
MLRLCDDFSVDGQRAITSCIFDAGWPLKGGLARQERQAVGDDSIISCLFKYI